MMNARLSSLLVAGAVTFTGLPAGSLRAEAPVAARTCAVQTATLASTDASSAVLTLTIPGFSETPRIQVLDHPHRVVVDLPGVDRGHAVGRQDLAALQHPLIERARMAQFASAPQPVTRMVLEVAEGTHIAVSNADGRVQLSLSAGTGHVQAKLEPAAALPAVEAPQAAPVAVAQNEAPAAAPVSTSVSAPASPSASLPELPPVGAGFQALPVMALGTAAPAQAPAPSPAPVQQLQTPGYSARTIGQGERRYTGAKVSIDLPNTDLQTFLRYLADVGHLNLVADQDVQGTYTYKFTDVPWDQVLDIVLKNAGLGKEIENGVLRVAKISTLQKEAEERGKLAEAKALSGDLETITRPLSYAKVSEASALVTKLLSKRGSVIVDDRTNTLIITDLPAYLKTAEDLLQTLDVQIQQVSIEARVVEANKNWQRAFGVSWPTSNSGDAQLSIGGQAAPWVSNNSGSWNSVNNRAAVNPVTGGLNPDGSLYSNVASAGFQGGAPGVTSIAAPAGQFWVSFLSNRFSINFILQALEQDGVVKIVSSPKVVTQNNRKASILSGRKIPYPTQQGGAAGGAITVAFIDANLQLDVTPQITNEGTILMDLHIQKSEADFSNTVNGTPSILQKSIETQVLVRDGGTAVLGGVYITNNTKQTTGVPFLMRLPIIGALFRNKTNSEATSELLIFITPRILHQ